MPVSDYCKPLEHEWSEKLSPYCHRCARSMRSQMELLNARVETLEGALREAREVLGKTTVLFDPRYLFHTDALLKRLDAAPSVPDLDDLVDLWKRIDSVLGDMELDDLYAWNVMVEARRQTEIMIRAHGPEGEQMWKDLT